MSTQYQFVKSSSTIDSSTSISVDNCFSDAYSVYHCILEVDAVSAELAMQVRFKNASGVVTSSNYDHASLFMRAGSGSDTEGRSTNDTKWNYTMYAEGGVGGFFQMYVFNPADSSSYTYGNWQTSTHYLASSTSVHLSRVGMGILTVAEAHTGIQVYGGSANLSEAKLSVYGVK